MLRRLRSTVALPLREQAWLVLLLPLSALVRGALLCLPFRRLAFFLGEPYGNVQLSPLASPVQLHLASRIGTLIGRMSRCTPWESRCLVQAILVKVLLTYYRIPCVVYLGVARPGNPGAAPKPAPASGLKAHAWVTVGSKVVAGRDGHRAFTVVGTFASPDLLRPC